MVPARPDNPIGEVFSSTGLSVQAGQTVSFSATGWWSAGLGYVGPDGTRSESLCECVVSREVGGGRRGVVGLLVGRLGESGTAFAVGTSKALVAEQSGVLFLTINDNLGRCDGSHPGSCFVDNQGNLTVSITIG